MSSKNRLLQQRCSASKSLEAGSRRCLVVDKRSVGLFDKGCNLGEDNNSYLSCAPCFIFIDNSFSMRSSAANIIYFCSCKVIQKKQSSHQISFWKRLPSLLTPGIRITNPVSPGFSNFITCDLGWKKMWKESIF